MCFRDPYDALDVSTMRRLNGILLEEATKKAEKRKAKEQARQRKRQEREEQRIAKAKARVEQKYGLRMQPTPSENGSGGLGDDTDPNQHHGHNRPSGDLERVVSFLSMMVYVAEIWILHKPSPEIRELTARVQ